MSNSPRLVPAGLTALALLTSLSRSQDPAAVRRAVESRAVADASPAVVAVSDGAIAHGRHYEAHLAHGEIEFRPVLGPRAPRSLPWRFRFESLWRGDDLLLTAPATTPELAVGPASATWALGGAVFERYEARREGLEQSFEFRERPAGTGDLVVRGRITTSMSAEPGADGSLRFAEPGVGGVQVGCVTGVDARGRTVPGSLRLLGDMLEMTLPAAFVDTAALPLVLDPLIGTWFDPTFGSTWSDGEPDVAYDATNDVYLVVWERVFAANDIAVRAQLMGGSGSRVGTILHLSTGPAGVVEERPRVCSVNAVDRFLVTWLAPGPGGTQVIEASLVDASTGVHTAPVVLVAPTFLGQPRSAELPCLAGDLSVSNQAALLVYHVRAGVSPINVARVEVPPAGDPVILAGNTHAAFTGVAIAPLGLSVSKTGGSAGRHVVALSYNDLRVAAVDRNALLIGSPVVITTHTNGRNLNPVTDGNGTDFLCVWEKERGSGAADHDILCTSLQASASGLTVGTGSRLINDRVLPGASHRTPDLVFLGGRYAVCFQQSIPGFPNEDDIRLGILSPDCTVCGPLFWAYGPGIRSFDSAPRLIGKRTGALGGDDEGLLVWADLLPSNDSDLRAQRFVSRSQGLSPTQIAPGCGVGGTAGTTGSGFVFGNQSFGLTVNNAAPGASLFCSLGFTTAPVVCGTCQILPPVLVDFVPNNAGSGVRPLPLPCDGGLLDALLQFQWISINAPTSPCPLVAGLATSAILQLQLVP